MKKCNNCGVSIIDNTNHCPFCKCVIKDNKENVVEYTGIGGYPDAVTKGKKYRFFGNLVLFLSICVALLCIGINLLWGTEVAWSLLVILGLVYANLILHFAILGQSGYKQKAITLTLIGIAVVIGIDALTGYKAWSANFVFPMAILLFDIAIIVLMIVNRRNWQSYMMTQLLMIVISLVGMLLIPTKIITWPYLIIAALIASGLLFTGTLILGDRRARIELKRRFHF